MKYPSILVVSNNAFSDTRNNGKTLASFFSGYPKEKLSQLYFQEELPSGDVCERFFCLSDKNVAKSLISRKGACGRIVEKGERLNSSEKNQSDSGILVRLVKSNLGRLARELAWRIAPWTEGPIVEWLDANPPDKVFFCAGDSAFAYDVVEFIRQRYGADLFLYITDDYILPRKTVSLAWWMRRHIVLVKMRAAITESQSVITISEKMRSEYKQLFGRDSYVAFNIPEWQPDWRTSTTPREYIELVYAGGLHFSRWKTLQRLAWALKRYNINRQHGKAAFLKIYTNDVPSPKMRSRIELAGAASYMGSLRKDELEEVIREADILVHVESFDSNSIESTRLSVSTKIPEYLAMERPVLAVGPPDVASMEFLEDAACCVTSEGSLDATVRELLMDETQRKKFAVKALTKWRALGERYRDRSNFQEYLFGIK
jgi:hypothetical protein